MAASPWPPPPHSATAAVEAPRRRSSSSAVSATRAPDMPTGWPSAMAPPLTLTLSSSMPRSSTEARPTAAKASLISKRSMAPRSTPALPAALTIAREGWVSSELSGPGHHAVADDLAQRRDPELLGLGGRHDDDGAAAVGDLRRVPGGDGAVLVEGGLQRAQRLRRRARAHTLVGVHQERVTLALGHLHRDDLLGQATLLGRRRGLLVAGRREGVLALARDADLGVVLLGREPHGDVVEGVGQAVVHHGVDQRGRRRGGSRRGRRAAGTAPGSSTPCRRPPRCRRRPARIIWSAR